MEIASWALLYLVVIRANNASQDDRFAVLLNGGCFFSLWATGGAAAGKTGKRCDNEHARASAMNISNGGFHFDQCGDCGGVSAVATTFLPEGVPFPAKSRAIRSSEMDSTVD